MEYGSLNKRVVILEQLHDIANHLNVNLKE